MELMVRMPLLTVRAASPDGVLPMINPRFSAPFVNVVLVVDAKPAATGSYTAALMTAPPPVLGLLDL